jgi:hypothetical protein
MLLLEQQLGEYFPGIDLSYVRQNETPGRTGDLGERVESVIRELGPELGREFQEQNHWDMQLYKDALAIMVERLGALGDVERKAEDFRRRCANLRTADIRVP